MFNNTAVLDLTQVQYAVCPVAHISAAQHLSWLGWHGLYTVAALLALVIVCVVADEGIKALKSQIYS